MRQDTGRTASFGGAWYAGGASLEVLPTESRTASFAEATGKGAWISKGASRETGSQT